jgi:hypothetical protein
MKEIKDLTTGQLRRILAIKEQIETLQSQINSIADGGNGAGMPSPFTKKRRRRMSRAARARIAAAQRARWAKIKGPGTKSQAKPAKNKDRRSSPAVRAKLAAAAKARWAKVRAEGKKKL